MPPVQIPQRRAKAKNRKGKGAPRAAKAVTAGVVPIPDEYWGEHWPLSWITQELIRSRAETHGCWLTWNTRRLGTHG